MPIDSQSLSRLSMSPMIGELTAGQLGVSSVFSGNTPTDYFVHSVDTLNRFLTQRGNGILQQQQGQRPDVVEVMPPGYDPSSTMPYPRGQSAPTQKGGDVNVLGDDKTGGVLDQLNKLNPYIDDFLGIGWLTHPSKETKIAMFLLVVGLILFTAGVFKMG